MRKVDVIVILASTLLLLGAFPAQVTASFEEPSIPVTIDIKPGSDPNSINMKSKGTIPVAILTDPSFDAATVNGASLTFGRTGAEHSLKFCNKSLEDIDQDGDLDKVCHFNTQLTGFSVVDTKGKLMGNTFSGQHIHGEDFVKIVK